MGMFQITAAAILFGIFVITSSGCSKMQAAQVQKVANQSKEPVPTDADAGADDSGNTAETPAPTPTPTEEVPAPVPTPTPVLAACTFNGQAIASGNSVTAYAHDTVYAGQTCETDKETRVCNDGKLSGRFGFSSCKVSTAKPTVGQTPGAYSYYKFPSGTPGFSSILFSITVNKHPGVNSNVFWSNTFDFTGDTNGSGAYIGLQNVNGGGENNLFLFSVWNATAAKSGSPGSYCLTFDGEGSGKSCRMKFNWQLGHTYQFVVISEGNHWFGATVVDANTGVSFKLGSIQTAFDTIMPASLISWTEYFEWSQPTANCFDQPYSQATFGLPVGTLNSVSTTAQLSDLITSTTCATMSKVVATGTGTIQTNAIGNTVRGPITSANYCLDASGGISNGTKAITYQCTGNSNQAWVLGADGTLRLPGGYCLTQTSSGAVIQTCNASASQHWSISESQIVNAGSGQCLSWTGSTPTSAAQLQFATCKKSSNQIWALPEKP